MQPKNGMSRNTFLDKIKIKTPAGRRMGPDSCLIKEEEEMLVEWTISKQFCHTHRQFFNADETTFFLNPIVSKVIARKGDKSVYQQTDFFLNPKVSKVIAFKGDKSVYQQVNVDEKECLTVVIIGNASGSLYPLVVCFKYEHLHQCLVASLPTQWGFGKSPNGWMTGEVLYEFMKNIFHPWLFKQNISLPVVLFVDGHSSHLILHTSKFCDEHGIILVALLPNATHILQPMDVGSSEN
ncbi:hypothetical protein PR048_011192 [Dryococelus australis]|uniref:DDE-1 domain-containing protein n=1 Tax=Dryococelus australis TaxID=614101 RepID=A0ABQ9HKX7_9NEOP|nr:hypothetical protein PR048_011192 [Dryococelus australis]